MRSWDKYCEDTEKAFVRYSLLQPIVGRFMQPEWR